jgi:uncharacterized SAM-binding protein YcdF (DUF218 family)
MDLAAKYYLEDPLHTTLILSGKDMQFGTSSQECQHQGCEETETTCFGSTDDGKPTGNGGWQQHLFCKNHKQPSHKDLDMSEANTMSKYFQEEYKVPEAKIKLEKKARHTIENGTYVLKMLERYKSGAEATELIIVTS